MEFFAIKNSVTNNTGSIGDNAQFISITKMFIDIHLLDLLICCGMHRYGILSSFVRIIVFAEVICFSKDS